MMKTPITEVQEAHVSVRQYLPQTVPDEMILAILRAARRAPTSSNLQAYSIVVVRDPDTLRRLAELAGNQRHVAETPVFLAWCADLSRVERACKLHNREFVGNTLEMGIVATVDAALTGMSAMTAAESFGLGCVMIGGMRNHPVEVARLLELPPRAYVVFGMCIGWPAERPPQKPRLPESAVIHFERYNGATADEVFEDAAWTTRVSVEFSKPRREHLRAALAQLGLPLE
jgi:FMN reductase (NADPH)